MENRESLLLDAHVKKVLELAPLGAFQTDLQGNCLYVNKEFENICGQQMQELSGGKWLGILVDDDVQQVTTMLKNLVSEQKNNSGFTFRICHPKNGIRYCKANVKPVFSDTGDALYFIGYLEDISAEKNKAEYMKLQNELLATLKSIQDEFYLSENPYRLFHKLLHEITKITRSEFGFIAEALWPQKETDPQWKKLATADATWRKDTQEALPTTANELFAGIGFLSGQLPADGGTYLLNEAKAEVFGAHIHSLVALAATINGRVEGMIVLANRQDGYHESNIGFLRPLLTSFANLLTFQKLNDEKKIAEEKQRDLTTHLQTLITSLEDIIFELDGHKVFKNVWVSDEALLFMPRELFIGKTVSDVFGPQATMFNLPLDQAIHSGEVTEITYQHIDSSVDKWFRAKIRPFHIDADPAKYRLAMSIQDITQRAKQEEALVLANQQLELSNTEKDRIMHMLAHDLRSPLSGIHSIAAMLLSNKRLSDKNRQMIQLISDVSLSSHDMINDLIEAFVNKKEVLKMNRENIMAVLERCVSVLQFRATEKKLHLSLATHAPVLMCIDAQKIERVINNLIGNAIKFCPVNSEILLTVKQLDTCVQITVKDTGIGIPDEIKGLVFDMFGKGKRHGTSGERSHGLGLSICRQIIEAHQGKIWFESEPEKGTTFFIELPYQK